MAAIKTEFLNSEFIGSSFFSRHPLKSMSIFNMPDFQHENGVFSPKTAKNLESL